MQLGGGGAEGAPPPLRRISLAGPKAHGQTYSPPKHQKIAVLRHVSSPSLGTFGDSQRHGWIVLLITNSFQSALFYVEPSGADLCPLEDDLDISHEHQISAF